MATREEIYKEAREYLEDKKFDEYFKTIKTCAEMGYPMAQYELGNCYNEGIGTERDLNSFFYWTKRASENGVALAQTNLGRCYQYGWGTEIDYDEALKWTRLAADNGDPVGLHNIATFYREGSLLPKDNSKAIEYYQKAADKGLARSWNDMGVCYQEMKDFPRAVSCYEKAVKENEPLSFKNLAAFYYHGCGVEKDELKAVQLLSDEPNQEDETVKSMLYLIGLKHLKRGIELVENDDEKEEKESILDKVTHMFMHERKKDSKHEDGWKYIASALKAEIPGAYLYNIRNNNFRIGFAYKRCWFLGGDMTYEELMQSKLLNYNSADLKEIWYKSEDAESIRDKGLFYYFGSGTKMARKPIGYSESLNTDVNIIEEEQITESDYGKAFLLFKESAQIGDIEANYWLGICYEYGRGVNADMATAARYYEMAASQRMPEAGYRYALYLLEHGEKDQKYMAVQILDSICKAYNPRQDNMMYNIYTLNWMGSTAWRALFLLGKMKFDGIVLEKDEENAIKLWELAQKWGSSEASYQLGLYYKNQDEQKSQQYFLNALFRGCFEARKHIKKEQFK